jgi:hypothetical protein
MAFFLAPGCSSRFLGILGAEVNDAHNGSWRRCFTAWLYLAANPSRMWVNVDGLACPLHHPTTCCRQMRGQGLLPSVVLSHRCSGWWCLFGDVNPPGLGYLVESWPPGYLCYRVLHGIHCFYQDMFTLCHNHRGV